MEEIPEPSASAPFASPGSTGNWVPPGIVELQPLLPDYQLSLVLGVGGMGAVYRGSDRVMGREVAIKILPVSAIEEDGMNYVERFKQEARAMALLNHPSIVKVYGCGEAGSKEDGNEILWFAMEYVEGSDIHHYLHDNGGQLAPEHAMAIICHVLDGLSAAHAQNLIHRDIKPANIMLDHEGHVKITDFGLAKSIDGSDLGLTMTNVAMGTPDYVAPESLICGAPVDGRADLYSVGAMLYQLLTGGVPRGQFKMPSEKVPGLDRRFDAIVSRALQTEPEDRYPDAAAFRADLNEILLLPEADFSPQSGAVKIAQGRKINTLSGVTSPVSVAASHTGPRTVAVEKKPKTGLIAGGIAAAMVIGAGAFFFFKPGSQPSAAVAPLALVDQSAISKNEEVPAAEKVDSTGYNDGPNPVTSETVQGTVSQSEPEKSEPETPVPAGDPEKPSDPGDLLAVADPNTSEAPELWTRFPDGSLQIDSGVLQEGAPDERHRKTYLRVPGNFSLPYRLEMDIEMVARNECLTIMFPVKGRAATLRLNQAARYNPCSLILLPPNPRHEGLAFEIGDRKTVTIDVTPWNQGANIEVFLDGELILERAGGTDIPKQLDSLSLAVWPSSVWKFHRISLSKPEPGGSQPKQPVPVDMTEASVEPKPALEPKSEAPEKAGNSNVPEILRSRVKRFDEVITNRATKPYRQRVLALSKSYEGAIDRATESAADAGNLELVIALRKERELVEKLAAAIPGSTRNTLPVLAGLGKETDPVLRDLRSTWQVTLEKYNEAYDEAIQDVTQKFAASLAVFETELTKERKIELAKVVHKYRLALVNGEERQEMPAPEIVGVEKEPQPVPVPNREPEPVTPPAGELVLAGQYEAVPLNDPVFPLPMRKRPNEPCKVVAWRLDGKPVNRRSYEAYFYSTPDKLGTVVDLDVWEKTDRGMQHRIVALTAEGKVRTSFEDAQRAADIIKNAVQVAGKRDVGIALLEDGTCEVFPLWGGTFGNGGWNGDVQRARKWQNIVAVDAGERHVLALGEDGTPYAAGDNSPQKGATVPAGIQKRTVRILAKDVNSIFFALGSGGNIVEMHHPNRGNQISRRIPRANRFFGHNPRIADKDGNKLDMYSGSAHVEKLIGAKPANVTFAQAVGGNYLGEQVWAAWLREGDDDWRFWADLGGICTLDSKYCSERAKGCRKVFLNPPYAIALKPVTRVTPEDWTGAGEDDSDYKIEPVTAVPEYRNIFPLASLERPGQGGRVEIFRRDGKPLNPNDPELKRMPKDLGDQVVDIKVQTSSDGFVGIVLLKDGTVRAWGTRFSPEFVDLTKLNDVVQICTGHHRFAALESSGDLFYWGPEGLRAGRMNEANEPVRRVQMTYNDGFFLTESGKVGAIQDGPRNWLAKDLPPSVALVAGHKPFALGIDGKWRSWVSTSKGWSLLPFESGGLKGDPHCSSNEVWWINSANRLQKVNPLGAPRDVSPFQNKEAKEVQGSAGIFFIRNQLDRWEVLTGNDQERKLFEDKIAGSRIIEVSKAHVFCVK